MLVSAAIASKPKEHRSKRAGRLASGHSPALGAAGRNHAAKHPQRYGERDEHRQSVASMAPPTFSPAPKASTVSATRATAPLAYVTAISVNRCSP